MNNNDIKETALYLVLAVFISVVVTFLLYANAYAQDPHHTHGTIDNTPTINMPPITINNTYIQDEVRLNEMEKSLSALNALSSVPSLSCRSITCTGIGMGFSGYNSGGAAIVLEHVEGFMSYRGGLGLSGDESIINFGVMRTW